MKLLVAGNHSCGNRGDAAILRGLLDGIAAYDPSIHVDVLSRFPTSSSYLLGRELLADPTALSRKRLGSSPGRRVRDKLVTAALMARAAHVPGAERLPLPPELAGFVERLSGYDAMIQVGGSFFVDVYSIGQFDQALCALTARTPVLLLGHSLGPFEAPNFRRVARFVLPRVDRLYVRESLSREVLEQSRISASPRAGADTAWLVEPTRSPAEAPASAGGRPRLAVTFRELAPFDKRLGIDQEQYERAFAALLDALIDDGYDVLALSTCTGIDGYTKDDRMVALRVRARCRRPERFEVEMRELNDVELGQAFAGCALTLGTRLHSAIISMNFGTPALALAYEHKSKGVLAQMGLSELSAEVKSLLDGELLQRLRALSSDLDAVSRRTADAVAAERRRAREMLVEALGSIAAAGTGV